MAPDADATAGASQGWHDLEAVLAEEPAATLLAAYLAAAVPEGGLEIGPWGPALVPTGLRIALPPGFELQVRPRSGTVLKRGLMVQNSPGTIDQDFRGEVGVILLNANPVAL